MLRISTCVLYILHTCITLALTWHNSEARCTCCRSQLLTPAFQALMVYIFHCHVGVVVDEVEVLPSDPPQRPTSVPQALQQNMPLASVSHSYPSAGLCFACCYAAALYFCPTTDATQHAGFEAQNSAQQGYEATLRESCCLAPCCDTLFTAKVMARVTVRAVTEL